MHNALLTNKKKLLVTGLSILTVSSLTYLAVFAERLSPVSPTETFIRQYMTNPNGTLATYLQEARSTNEDIAAGREALSESLGIWLQYAWVKGDRQLFADSFRLLRTFFLSPQNRIYWKLSPDGQPHVTTNALGDDLRIVDALWKAADSWENEEYAKAAEAVTQSLFASSIQHGCLVDFYDFAKKESPQTLSLVYVDMSALKRMADHNKIDANVYQRYRDLLMNMPNDGIFYPKIFHVENQMYSYVDSVNLIDQLIVAINLAEAGRTPRELVVFLKKEFAQQHQLPGRYDRASRTAAVSYESPAVYGLAILLALKLDDPQWANQLQARMVQLRSNDSRFLGGYVFQEDTHAFDNLVPLLAEEALRTYKD